jgi:hypothetical protein
MNTSVNLKHLIAEAIKDLPQSYLSEIADFVFFMKQKAIEQQPYGIETIPQELWLMNSQEQAHLEKEFADFDQQFPKE